MALSGLLLAKIMTPAEYGIYGHALALVSLAAVIGAFGTETFLVREIGAGAGEKDSTMMKSRLTRFALTVSAMVSIGAAIILAMVIHIAGTRGAGQLPPWSVFALCLMVFLLSQVAALKGLAKGEQRFVIAQFPDGILRPWLLMLAVSTVFLLGASVDASIAIGLYCVALLISFVALLSVSKFEVAGWFRPEPCRAQWTKACLALLLVAAVMVLNRRLDVMMLGFMVDDVSTGGYVLATRIADGLTVFFTALSISLAARCSKWIRGGDIDTLQASLRIPTRWVFLLTTLTGSLVLLASGVLLAWFNPLYVSAQNALAILVAAQLINTGFGLTGLLLVLSGDQGWYAKLLAVGACLNIMLNLWLIPEFGIVGAAGATLVVTLLWNVYAWIRLRNQVGVDCSVLGVAR